jgi:flavin-dependent dehydrogenase
MVDVIVIGGGPAGSTAATMLTRRGFAVTLLERERFPREHIGESLLPASMPILHELGVLDAIEGAGFLKKWGATMVWGAEREPWSWHFRETNLQYPHSYQVSRPEFDQILLRNSTTAGATVREGCRVLEVVIEGNRALGVRYLDESGSERTLRARHIVDASGQSGVMGRALGLRQNDEHFRNLAVYGYFEGARGLPEPNETNIFIESFEHGWFWNIPLHTGEMSVGAVVDSKYGQEQIALLGVDVFFAAQVAAAPATAAMLEEARLVRGPSVIRDWSYVSKDVTGPGWVLAGDAACFIDPLFSTGVHLALSSGIMAAAFVTAALTDPELAAAAAPVYKELYYQQYSHFRELARLFYASNRSVESYFWEVRRVLADDSLTPREAFVRATAGQSARGYERIVLQHGELPVDFVRELRTLEAEQSSRAAHGRELAESGRIAYAVPVLSDEVRVERKPVLTTGDFAWGDVVISPSRPEGIEISAFIRRLIEAIDGRRTVADIAERLAGSGPDSPSLTPHSSTAVQVLYTDGIIDRLEATE